MPKSRKCPICMRAKMFHIPHRMLKNQSELKQAAHELRKATKPLDRLILDHAVIGEAFAGRNKERSSLRIIDE